jgi:hypothetical protein
MTSANLSRRSFQQHPQTISIPEDVTPGILPLVAIVESGGGSWCGLQYAGPHSEPLCLFTDPETGSTLALGLSAVSTLNVKAKIAAKREAWGRR